MKSIVSITNNNMSLGRNKNRILAFVLLLFTNVFFAQASLDKFDGQEGVTSIVVNKKMFQMMASVKVDTKDKETQQYLDLIKKLDNLKAYTTTSDKIANEMKITAEKYIKAAGLEELMRVNDSGKNVKIYVKSGAAADQVRELLMFIDDDTKQNKTVLLSLTGDFSLSEIAILTDKMNIPGGDDLKKATKKK